MKLWHLLLVLGIVDICWTQKAPKARPGYKNEGVGDPNNQQYTQNPYNQGGGHGGNFQAQPQLAAAKATYPLLLSDSRTLNNDGTINFQYAADNGLQQGETVDADGTRRGFYSYPGADGKPITVKYTAGKNGFIAEGDHLPKQPIVPGHSEKDEGAYDYPDKGQAPQERHHGGGHSPQPYRPYDPPAAPVPQKEQGKYQLAQPAGPQQFNHGGPPRYSGQPQFQQGGHRPPPPRSPESQAYQGISPAGIFGRDQGYDFGPVNYGAPSQSSNRYNAPPRAQPQGGHSNVGQGYPGLNQSPAGIHNGQFDLGNGGQFQINFNPGQSREVAIWGDYSNPPQHGSY